MQEQASPNVQLNINEMGTVKTRVFVSSEGIKKTVYLPPDKIQSDGNSTIIKWHVPDPMVITKIQCK